MPILSSLAHRPREFDRLAHQTADTAPVEHLERIVFENPLLEVDRNERALGVVAAVAVGRLREIVGSEREKLGVAGELVGDDARPRQFDHRADVIGQRDAVLGEHFVRDPLGRAARHLHLFLRPDAGNHHLRARVDAFTL